ncbi:hypothetical protein FRC00_010251, partial [Tulasnella sp. 408]
LRHVNRRISFKTTPVANTITKEVETSTSDLALQLRWTKNHLKWSRTNTSHLMA